MHSSAAPKVRSGGVDRLMRGWQALRSGLSVLLAVLLAAVLPLALAAAQSEAVPQRLVILHTNDLHGQIRPKTVVLRPGVERLRGGFLGLSEFVRTARQAASEASMVLWLTDGGDWFQGTPEGNEDRGRALMACRNRLDFTAVVIGNHEFDFGERNLATLVGLARHPVLGANIVEHGKPLKLRPYARPFLIKQLAGIRIALVGLLASDTKLVSTGPFGAAEFLDEVDTLRRLWPQLQREADQVVLITHCGVNVDRKLAVAFPAVRLILGGHSHTALPVGLRQGQTWIVQSSGKSTAISRVSIDLDPDKRRLQVRRVELVEVPAVMVQPRVDRGQSMRRETAAFLSTTFAHIGAKWDTPIGVVKGAQDRRARGSGRSTPAGNYVADLIRRVATAEVGLTNKGGLRATLRRGEITRRQVFQLLPFDNSVRVMSMSGVQLRAVLAQGLRSGRLPLEIAGAKYSYALLDGRRVLREVEVGGQAIRAAQLYRVATNSFLAAGGDGFSIFSRVESRPASAEYLRAIMLGELAREGSIRLFDEQRIRLVE